MGGLPARHRSERLLAATLAVVAVLGAACSPAGASQAPSAAARQSASASASPSPVDTPRASAEASGPSGASDGVYLAIGDSITFGIGVARPQDEGYVARVAEALAADAAPVRIGESRVFAVPGETATGFLERRLDDVIRAIGEYGERVELVTIGLGANELLRARREPACEADRDGVACGAVIDAATAAAVDAVDRIVGAVQAELALAGSEARVLLLAYYNPDPDPLAGVAIAGADGIVGCTTADPGLDDRIACVAEERGAALVDLHAAFRGRELELTRFGSGDVHPNASGYAVIADAILARLAAGP